MSSLASGASRVDRVTATHALRDWIIAGLAAAVSLFILYAVFMDQGALLYPILGKTSWTANYLHESLHDGRHLLGAPCH